MEVFFYCKKLRQKDNFPCFPDKFKQIEPDVK